MQEGYDQRQRQNKDGGRQKPVRRQPVIFQRQQGKSQKQTLRATQNADDCDEVDQVYPVPVKRVMG